MYKLIFGAAAICFSVYAAESPPKIKGTLTKEQAIRLALDHNPSLKARILNLRIAEAESAQSRLWANPELNFYIEEFSGDGSRKDFDAAETSITLSKTLDLSGRRRSRTRLAASAENIAALEAETARLETIRNASKAFIQLLSAQEHYSIAIDEVKLADSFLDTVRKRVTAGKDSQLAEHRAEIECAKARLDKNNSGSALEVSRREMAATWGGRTAEFTKGEGVLEQSPELPPPAGILEKASASPQFLQLKAEQDISKAELAAANAEGRIDLNIEAGLVSFEENDETAWMAGVSLPLPLFNRNQGGRKAAKHNVEKSSCIYDAAAESFLKQTAYLYSRLKAAKKNVQLLKNDIMKNAESAHESATLGYRSGKYNYLQVLEAQKVLFESRKQMTDEMTRSALLQAELEMMIGQSLNNKPVKENSK